MDLHYLDLRMPASGFLSLSHDDYLRDKPYFDKCQIEGLIKISDSPDMCVLSLTIRGRSALKR